MQVEQHIGVSLCLRANFSGDFFIVKYDLLSLESHRLETTALEI